MTQCKVQDPLYIRACTLHWKYLWYKDLEVSTILYTFVSKKREQLCFQKVVRKVVIKRSKYCYKNATLPICQNYRIFNYNELAEFGSQTSLSA